MGCASVEADNPFSCSTLQDPVELDNITTLSNGVRVATEALPGPFSGVGVYVDAGSRYENEELRGVSHIIDRLAFKVCVCVGAKKQPQEAHKTTQSTRSRTSDEMLETIETLGGNIQCASSRETLMYQSATFNDSVPTALSVLSDTIRNPLITEDEVQQQLETADYEIGEIWSKPELILPELVHIAAYKNNTLGNPLLCPKERLGEITKSTVERYRATFYKPERMVVAFAGVSHTEAVKLTEQYFGDMRGDSTPALTQQTSSPSNSPSAAPAHHQATYSSPKTQEPSRLLSKIPFFKNLSTSAAHHATPTSPPPSITSLQQPSLYTGGFLSLPPLPPPANPALPRLSYIHLAFEALPISSPSIYALATLQTLLGGGGSFSAGGPGKGMYSRLYTNVLNQHHWVESCVAFNHSYTDSGLFGISASCAPARTAQMLEVMCRELASLGASTGHARLQEPEVRRAKNQLRSALLMNLESRMVELEDLGRQVQVHGRKIGVADMCAAIERVGVEELRQVARSVGQGLAGRGSGAPTVVLQEGEEEDRVLRALGWEEIQERVARWKLGRR